MKTRETPKRGDVIVLKRPIYQKTPARLTVQNVACDGKIDCTYLDASGDRRWEAVDPRMVDRIEPRQHGWTG